MTKPIDSETVRKALETAAALERVAQSAWEERSRAVALFESSWSKANGSERAHETREV